VHIAGRGLVVLSLGIIGLAGSPVQAADPKPSEVAKRLAAVEEAQRALTTELGTLREQLKGLEERIGEVRDEARQDREALQADREQLKGMREEVRGLYVETNGVKGDIAQLGKDIESVSGNFGNFRFSSGALIAVVIVLQIVTVALALRRG
jgi:chromosome segregation ATPase